MIAVCLPSRGLVHSRTIESILYEMDGSGIEYKLFFTHDLPIPECFNDLTQRALAWGADIVWFIEEDIGIVPDTLDKMLAGLKEHDVVACNYKINPTHDVVQTKDEFVIFGTGCTMIKRNVFGVHPVWRSDVIYTVPEYEELYIKPERVGDTYGKHDIHFAIQCAKLNVPVKILDIGTQHWRVQEFGQVNKNKGYHIIYEAGEKEEPRLI